MRSKATQRIKDRKRIARRRKIVRLTNMRQPFGHSARLIQTQRNTEQWNLGAALGHFFGLLFSRNEGPRKPDQKDWEK
jgi:hypothetical protein